MLFAGTISMPLYTAYILSFKTWRLGEILCDLWLSIDYTACLCSIYTVFCITVDRFCSIRIPASYRTWRTRRKVSGLVNFKSIVCTVVGPISWSDVYYNFGVWWVYVQKRLRRRPAVVGKWAIRIACLEDGLEPTSATFIWIWHHWVLPVRRPFSNRRLPSIKCMYHS